MFTGGEERMRKNSWRARLETYRSGARSQWAVRRLMTAMLFRKMKHSSITTKGGNSEEATLYAEWKLTTGSTGTGIRLRAFLRSMRQHSFTCLMTGRGRWG